METPAESAELTSRSAETVTGTAPTEVVWPATEDSPRSECGADVRLTWESR